MKSQPFIGMSWHRDMPLDQVLTIMVSRWNAQQWEQGEYDSESQCDGVLDVLTVIFNSWSTYHRHVNNRFGAESSPTCVRLPLQGVVIGECGECNFGSKATIPGRVWTCVDTLLPWYTPMIHCLSWKPKTCFVRVCMFRTIRLDIPVGGIAGYVYWLLSALMSWFYSLSLSIDLTLLKISVDLWISIYIHVLAGNPWSHPVAIFQTSGRSKRSSPILETWPGG